VSHRGLQPDEDPEPTASFGHLGSGLNLKIRSDAFGSDKKFK
jgi:hypothetical protein